jgi:hypothetical protein
MNQCFIILNKDDDKCLSKQLKVEYLTKGIKVKHPCIQAGITVII